MGSTNQEITRKHRGILTAVAIGVFLCVIYFLFKVFLDSQVAPWGSAVISVGAGIFIVYVIMGINNIVKAFTFKAGPLEGSADFQEKLQGLGKSVSFLEKQVKQIARKETKRFLKKYNLTKTRVDPKDISPLSSEAKNELEDFVQYYKGSDEIEEFLSQTIPTFEPPVPDIQDLMERALVLYYDEKYDDALKLFEQVLQQDNSNLNALFNKGLCLYKQKKFSEALQCFKHVLAVEPKNVDTLYNIGLMYGMQGDFENEEMYYDKVLQLDKNHYPTIYNKACNRALRGEKDEAIKFLKQAIDLNSEYKEKAKTDEDFKNIKDEPRFGKLIE